MEAVAPCLALALVAAPELPEPLAADPTVAPTASDAEVTGSTPPTASVPAPVWPATAPVADRPQRLDPPRFSGLGLRIAGHTLTGFAFATRAVALGFSIASLREQGNANDCAWDDSCDPYRFDTQVVGFQVVSALAGAAALPMVLSGGFLAGRNDAHGRVYGGGGRVRKRRLVLGWTLFGTGLAAIAITRIPFAEFGDATNYVVRDVGFLGGMILAVPGALLGGYAAGYANTMRRVQQLSLAPAAGRGFAGVSISGRF